MYVEREYGYEEACFDAQTNVQTIFYNRERDPVNHWPLDLDPSVPSTVVTMFRDPYLRARSVFMYASQKDLRPIQGTDPNMTFAEYVRLRNMKNCQTAMLTSKKGCYHFGKNNPNITMAKDLIRQPNFFFGITERWDETLCLFHHWFGGEVQTYELKNNRKTTANSRYKVYHHMLDNVTRETMPRDLDTLLFEDAEKVFDARLRDAGCLNWAPM
uniref:Sulfotransferase domain-containing protein n=1 Tax=Grammatophora oceanica TaxID=210454 RepID=A0A7S1Y1H1_9STRA|mmetsp:Transcript_17936/g.26614  ORF Transcript_17936/g.26614 Transcript_17936/m.26614 type:complete len:214 (+) Transcript_17936:1022-1663(+)